MWLARTRGHRDALASVLRLVRFVNSWSVAFLRLSTCALIVSHLACAGEAALPERDASQFPSDASLEAFPVEVVDDSGVRHRFQAPPTRIVSLVPSATQTLLALGVGGRLVGRTDFDQLSELAALPSVGGGLQPNLEVLVSLEPDFVVRFEGESDRATANRLTDLGIPNFAIRPDGIDDVLSSIERLGLITDQRVAADALLAEIRGDLADVAARVEGRPRRRVVYLMGGEPPWVAGPGTYIDELVVSGGAVNVFDDLEGLYGPISLEELITREVDLVLVSDEGGSPDLIDVEHASIPSWVEVPGPGLGEAAKLIARLIHPEAFP